MIFALKTHSLILLWSLKPYPYPQNSSELTADVFFCDYLSLMVVSLYFDSCPCRRNGFILQSKKNKTQKKIAKLNSAQADLAK